MTLRLKGYRFGARKGLEKFSKNQLSDVEVVLGEANELVREGVRSVLHDYGFRHVRTFAHLPDLINAIRECPPDLLLVSDNIDPALFDVVRDIRHFKIGRNPFMIISLMVAAENGEAVRRAILAGSDDVMIKPVAPCAMLDRVAYFTMSRMPFIATNDYLGPERRKSGDGRPSSIRRLDVVNTLKAKVEGHRISMMDLDRVVEGSMKDVMSARLDSHGLKLGLVCGHILKAYEENRIDKELKERLLILGGVLEDAARTARAIGQPDLVKICTRMARQVEEMAEHYEHPTSPQLETIQKLTKAFELAKAAKRGTPDATPPP